MATYNNNLRLTEIASGDEAGTWGDTTNTNLQLIGEALGYATSSSFSSDGNATETIGDGAVDNARALYLKVTSGVSLTATRTLTIAPNTISRVMFIENATTGSQSIEISQGSGANVTIGSGLTKCVYLDGAGAAAAVVDVLALCGGPANHIFSAVQALGNYSHWIGTVATWPRSPIMETQVPLAHHLTLLLVAITLLRLKPLRALRTVVVGPGPRHLSGGAIQLQRLQRH
jgi:hypothetical protein